MPRDKTKETATSRDSGLEDKQQVRYSSYGGFTVSNDDTVADSQPKVKCGIFDDVPTAELPTAAELVRRQYGVDETGDKTKPNGNVLPTYADLEARQLARREIDAIQNIIKGKSVNDFTSEETRKTEALARREWDALKEKSLFFRAWFGDWRVNDKTPVEVASERGAERGTQRNDDTGWNINVSGKVFAESQHFAKKNQAALPYLPYINDIVKKAVLLDSFTMDESKSDNSMIMHSLYAVADIGGRPELLKLYVEEMADPNSTDTAKRAYQLQNIERQQSGVKGSAQAPSPITQTADIETVADLFAAVKSRDENFQPKAASKAVNRDGTPKMIYRGDGEDFNVFDRKKSYNGPLVKTTNRKKFVNHSTLLVCGDFAASGRATPSRRQQNRAAVRRRSMPRSSPCRPAPAWRSPAPHAV